MQKILSVDVMRVIAIIAVIALHTVPFVEIGNDYCGSLCVFISQLCRFAVPFFFIISGYFWGKKITTPESVILISFDRLWRIGIIYVFWCLIFLLPYNLVSLIDDFSWQKIIANLNKALNSPFRTIYAGSAYHLWFLSSLMFAIFISSLFILFKKEKAMLVFSFTLFVIGVLGGAYKNTPIGFDLGTDTRNGPFFSTFLFASGYFLLKLKPNETWFLKGLLILMLGATFQKVELNFNFEHYGASLAQDYTFGTYFMGLGAALIALSNHKFLQLNRIARFGKYTLGIYIVHVIFVDNLKIIDKQMDHPIWEIGYVFLVLILSYILVRILACNKYTSRFVL